MTKPYTYCSRWQLLLESLSLFSFGFLHISSSEKMKLALLHFHSRRKIKAWRSEATSTVTELVRVGFFLKQLCYQECWNLNFIHPRLQGCGKQNMLGTFYLVTFSIQKSLWLPWLDLSLHSFFLGTLAPPPPAIRNYTTEVRRSGNPAGESATKRCLCSLSICTQNFSAWLCFTSNSSYKSIWQGISFKIHYIESGVEFTANMPTGRPYTTVTFSAGINQYFFQLSLSPCSGRFCSCLLLYAQRRAKVLTLNLLRKIDIDKMITLLLQFFFYIIFICLKGKERMTGEKRKAKSRGKWEKGEGAGGIPCG